LTAAAQFVNDWLKYLSFPGVLIFFRARSCQVKQDPLGERRICLSLNPPVTFHSRETAIFKQSDSRHRLLTAVCIEKLD
jgi:hypothetical protein